MCGGAACAPAFVMRSSRRMGSIRPQFSTRSAAVYRVIGALREVLACAEDPAAVIARMVALETRIVTATVTEKGHCLGAGKASISNTRRFATIQSPDRPSTLVWFLGPRRCANVAMLARTPSWS